ncbi:MAG: XdhC family protein [Chitinophagaceae bacterium]|nr:XdhC family protein [Chitinophagaceae bacterium]
MKASIPVEILYVVESEGSSPGRQGFFMAVAADAGFSGTIGGGIMEYKLVEKAKALLAENDPSVLLIRQYHDKEGGKQQSGMICSGSQLIALIPLTGKDQHCIDLINDSPNRIIRLSHEGLALEDGEVKGLLYRSDTDWDYTDRAYHQPVIHIIGGGHVGLALSELMCFLGFYSKVYDDRKDLNTILQNFFANEKITVSAYENINEYIPENRGHFVVIMTTGYRTDKIVLKQLVQKEFAYLGVLGSQNKADTIFSELREEGVSESELKKVFMPVGLAIHSKTPQEIAVSIASEVIREKNAGLPTGRLNKS